MPGPGKRFEKGNPGGGRPRSNLSKLLSLKAFSKNPETGKLFGQELVDKLFELAASGRGDIDAIKYVFERLEGKIPEALDLTSGGKTLADFYPRGPQVGNSK